MKPLAWVALVLGVILAWEWYSWQPPKPPVVEVSGEKSPDAPPEVVLAELPEPEHYGVVAERPIFTQDRRPPKGEPTAKEEPVTEEPTPLPDFDLTAILLTPAGKTAWLKKPGGMGIERLLEGDQLEGWTLSQIREDRVILERQGEKNTLVLRDFSNKKVGTPQAARGAVKQPQRSPGAQRPPIQPRATERPKRPDKVANQ